jgi:ABC-2 type transport system permease protein
MTDGHPMLLVAAREIKERMSGKAFVVGTLVIAVLVVGAVVIPALDRGTPRFDVGLSGRTPAALKAFLASGARAEGGRLALRGYPDEATARAALKSKRADVLIVDGRRLVWRSEPDARVAALAVGALRQLHALESGARLGLTTAQLRDLLAAPIPSARLQAPDPDRESRETIAMIGFLVLLIVLVWYGNAVAQGVAQEKGDRVMELLLCRVRSRDLLAGKVVGIGVVGLAQMVAAACAGLIATVVFETRGVPSAVPAAIGSAVLWFGLGYALWSVAFAATGALASRAEDLQAVVLPLSWALTVASFSGPVAAAAPSAWYAYALSFFPLTAPFAMPARVAMSHVAPLEVTLAALLTIGATYLLVRAAAAIYAGSLLRTGAPPSLRDAWRALRSA